MFELTQIELIEYSKYIEELYKTDSYFISIYHIEEPSLDNCVKDAIDTASKVNNLYCIKCYNKLVAIFGRELFEDLEFMTGFFISPEFRKHKQEIFTIMDSVFKNKYYVNIESKNKRAVTFFYNNGFDIDNIKHINNYTLVVLKKR